MIFEALADPSLKQAASNGHKGPNGEFLERPDYKVIALTEGMEDHNTSKVGRGFEFLKEAFKLDNARERERNLEYSGLGETISKLSPVSQHAVVNIAERIVDYANKNNLGNYSSDGERTAAVMKALDHSLKQKDGNGLLNNPAVQSEFLSTLHEMSLKNVQGADQRTSAQQQYDTKSLIEGLRTDSVSTKSESNIGTVVDMYSTVFQNASKAANAAAPLSPDGQTSEAAFSNHQKIMVSALDTPA